MIPFWAFGVMEKHDGRKRLFHQPNWSQNTHASNRVPAFCAFFRHDPFRPAWAKDFRKNYKSATDAQIPRLVDSIGGHMDLKSKMTTGEVKTCSA